MRIRDYALALDGGTQIIVLETGDGRQITIGLDGRLDSPADDKQLFIENSPEIPDTRMLPIGGTEEREVISLLEEWLEKTQGLIRKESLIDADQLTLKGQDLLDRMALEFFLEISHRDIDKQEPANALQKEPVQACRKTYNNR